MLLLLLCIAGSLCFLLAVLAMVKACRVLLDRVGLDPMATLLWLGLAEWPLEDLPRR